MKTKEQMIDALDACLPQTQCRLCNYPGCRPYASAIINSGESINHCLPGGTSTLQKLADLTQQDSSPYLAGMQKKAKSAARVLIREDECIGCTKCITACPVDAIIGSAKLMHTVINDVCTGCELCIPVCPVDCIDLITIATREPTEQLLFAQRSKQRYQRHVNRLQQQRQQQEQSHEIAKLQQLNQKQTVNARQAVIYAAIAREKEKKADQLDKKS